VEVETLDSGETLDYVTLEFHGGDNSDTLTQTGGGIHTVANGDAGNDSLQGSRYNDTLDGGAGSDTYVFSGNTSGDDLVLEAANVDRDTLDFSNFGERVSVDLSLSYAYGGSLFVEFDSTSIEDVYGSAFSDGIYGNSRDNHLYGLGGRDRLEGRAGNDTLEGGSGDDQYIFESGNLGTDIINEAANSDNDTLSFLGMTHGVGVNLSKTGSDYAVNNTDLKLSLSNDTAIETVYGTNYDDKILGNSRNNFLYGFGGRDGIQGMAGVDELHGGADDDILYADALDHAYGEGGIDYFNGTNKETNGSANPRPGIYMDWGVI
jgi:Ca2+-binding RTX toxin-like protein